MKRPAPSIRCTSTPESSSSSACRTQSPFRSIQTEPVSVPLRTTPAFTSLSVSPPESVNTRVVETESSLCCTPPLAMLRSVAEKPLSASFAVNRTR